jgi:hypothetical protein
VRQLERVGALILEHVFDHLGVFGVILGQKNALNWSLFHFHRRALNLTGLGFG